MQPNGEIRDQSGNPNLNQGYDDDYSSVITCSSCIPTLSLSYVGLHSSCLSWILTARLTSILPRLRASPPCRLPLLCCLITDTTLNMSTTEDSHGEVGGRPVSWRYQRAENDKEANFSWAEQDGNGACKYCQSPGVVSFGRLHLTRSSD